MLNISHSLLGPAALAGLALMILLIPVNTQARPSRRPAVALYFIVCIIINTCII